jgi:hypothetical protein
VLFGIISSDCASERRQFSLFSSSWEVERMREIERESYVLTSSASRRGVMGGPLGLRITQCPTLCVMELKIPANSACEGVRLRQHASLLVLILAILHFMMCQAKVP